MPLSRSRDYLSIGEVLDSLREEFPDVSISKIRFLESEGLISPERTTSGYRKFFRDDVDRLRSILALQRDHFLPLKVIRDRLAAGGALDGAAGEAAAPTPRVAQPPAGAEPSSSEPEASPVAALTGAQLHRDELARAANLAPDQLAALEDFGVLARPAGDVYDETDLLIARAAGGMLELGLEARHVRMYRQFAEREAGLFEQLVAPVARRKAGDGQSESTHALNRLATLARQMHEGMLRSSLRSLL